MRTRHALAFTDVPHLEGRGSTGAYKVVGVAREHDTVAATESQFPVTASVTSRDHVISQGKAPNYFDDFATHLTVTRDFLDVQFTHVSQKCTGSN